MSVVYAFLSSSSYYARTWWTNQLQNLSILMYIFWLYSGYITPPFFDIIMQAEVNHSWTRGLYMYVRTRAQPALVLICNINAFLFYLYVYVYIQLFTILFLLFYTCTLLFLHFISSILDKSEYVLPEIKNCLQTNKQSQGINMLALWREHKRGAYWGTGE